MKKYIHKLLSSLVLLTVSGFAYSIPVSIDFETNPIGPVATYTEADVTFSPEAPGTLLDVVDLSFGRGIIGTNPMWQPIRADIFGGTSFVEVVLGDASNDDDEMFLRAYDSLDTLLDSDAFSLTGTGTGTLSVSSLDISYVIFGSISTINNSSVLVDTFTYEAVGVPEPTTLALLGLGLVGIVFSRKKKTA